MINIPNLLTWSRIAIVPLIVLTMIIDTQTMRYIAFVMFVIGGISDFLDGMLARRWKQCSAFGSFLDPVADKALVCTTLVMLVATGSISGYHTLAVVIIILREVLISATREYAALNNIKLASSQIAKMKTVMQIVGMSSLLFARAIPMCEFIRDIGLVLMWFSAFLAVYSAALYLTHTFRARN